MRRLKLACSLLVIGTVAGTAGAQTTSKPTPPSTQDWPKLVEKANQHRRMMLRRAIAIKVVAAGDAAVPAVKAFEQKYGRNSITVDFVDAYMRSNVKQPRTLELLQTWALDRDFYWRSQALGALANQRLPELRGLFEKAVADAAFMTRIHAGRGLCFLGGEADKGKVLALLRDEDPRVRRRIGETLVLEGDMRGLPVLVEALRQTGSFLGVPWGLRGANRALKTLAKVAGEDFGYDASGTPRQNEAAIDAFEAFAKAKLGDKWQDPPRAVVDKTNYLGGMEVRSCRNGDLFVRWTKGGMLVFGLESKLKVDLAPEAWQALRRKLPGSGDAVHGKVVCDYLRLMCQNPGVHSKSAPGALPEELLAWLTDLAGILEQRNRKLAGSITERLGQFAPKKSSQGKSRQGKSQQGKRQ